MFFDFPSPLSLQKNGHCLACAKPVLTFSKIFHENTWKPGNFALRDLFFIDRGFRKEKNIFY